MVPSGATLADISTTVTAYPGVLDFTLTEDMANPALLIDLRLVERDFDLDTFKREIKALLPVAIRLEVSVSGQAHPDKPNPFIEVALKDYDADMTDAELRLRLITERG